MEHAYKMNKLLASLRVITAVKKSQIHDDDHVTGRVNRG